MANTEEIFNRIQTIISEHVGVSQETVTSESRLVEDLGFDSLDRVELVMELEDEFGLSIGDDAADALLTVQNVVDYVSANLIEA